MLTIEFLEHLQHPGIYTTVAITWPDLNEMLFKKMAIRIVSFLQRGYKFSEWAALSFLNRLAEHKAYGKGKGRP